MFHRWQIIKLFIVLIFTIIIYNFYICLPSPLYKISYSTLVTDNENQLLGARLSTDEQWIFPPVDSLSDKYKSCLLQFEDKHFYKHFGINPLAIARAIKQNLTSKKIASGGSTITMQAIRLSRKQKRTYLEKIIEMILAVRLELSYSKDEILKMYASHVPMGGNIIGIEAASQRYFNHSAYNLSWSEAALLAVLPNSPSQIRLDKNRLQLLQKRNKLLGSLFNKKILSETDYKLAIEEPLPSHIYAFPQFAQHLVDKIHKEQRGEKVKTSICRFIQQQTEDILSSRQAELSKKRIDNCCALIVDIQTGKILSYVGNTNYQSGKNGNKMDIIQSARSTGSILKPFLYAAMLDNGSLLPDQLIADIPININGFTPKNFNVDYDGAVQASKALARSLNIPWVLKLKEYSIFKFYNLLKEFGFSHLTFNAEHYGLSIILGGAEATLWENTQAYLLLLQQLLNDETTGNIHLHYIEADNELHKTTINLNNQNSDLPGRGAAWCTVEALTEVNRPEEIDWKNIPSIKKIAWKTGTSFGFRDAISIGTDGKHLVGVWVGNADGEGRPDIIGATTAGVIMFDLFNILPFCEWFQFPEGDLIQSKVCKDSGYLAGNNCPKSSIVNKYIPLSHDNYAFCPFHQTIYTTPDKRYRIDKGKNIVGISSSPSEWFILPPVWENYYRRKNPDYQTLPPYHPSLSTKDGIRNMEFIYPLPEITIKVPTLLGGKKEGVIFELAHRLSDRKVFWYLDEDFIGQTETIHKISYIPTSGKHKLVAIDTTGECEEVCFDVI